MNLFSVGDHVRRIEPPVNGKAVVLTVQEGGDYDETVYEIEYVEGGSGWWPESALEADDPA